MSTDEYVPSDEQIRDEWISAMTTEDPDNYWDAITDEVAHARWSAFLARVRRDAAREADARIEAWEKQYAYDIDQANAHIDAAEARIKAVEDVLDAVDDGQSKDPVIRGMYPRMVNTAMIRRALDT